MTVYNNEELKKLSEQIQTEWTKNIDDLTPLIRNKINDIIDANALAVSYRTMLVDRVKYFVDELSSILKIHKQLKAEKFIYYATGLLPDGTKPPRTHPIVSHKKNKGETDMLISSDLNDVELSIDIIENLLNFLRDQIKTLDQFMYAVKNRLEIYNILNS